MPLGYRKDFPGLSTLRDLPFLRVFDVSVYKQAVHLRVNVLDENLKAIETTSFWDLHLLAKACHLPTPKSRTVSTVKPVTSDSSSSLLGETIISATQKGWEQFSPTLNRYVNRIGVVQKQTEKASSK